MESGQGHWSQPPAGTSCKRDTQRRTLLTDPVLPGAVNRSISLTLTAGWLVSESNVMSMRSLGEMPATGVSVGGWFERVSIIIGGVLCVSLLAPTWI